MTDLNTLIWLKSIYNYDVLQFDKVHFCGYQADAHDVTLRQDPAYTRQFQ